jgi:hypothetical protein
MYVGLGGVEHTEAANAFANNAPDHPGQRWTTRVSVGRSADRSRPRWTPIASLVMNRRRLDAGRQLSRSEASCDPCCSGGPSIRAWLAEWPRINHGADVA